MLVEFLTCITTISLCHTGSPTLWNSILQLGPLVPAADFRAAWRAAVVDARHNQTLGLGGVPPGLGERKSQPGSLGDALTGACFQAGNFPPSQVAGFKGGAPIHTGERTGSLFLWPSSKTREEPKYFTWILRSKTWPGTDPPDASYRSKQTQLKTTKTFGVHPNAIGSHERPAARRRAREGTTGDHHTLVLGTNGYA